MKRFKVQHKVLCEVSAWRVVEAKNYAEALAKVAQIQTVTADDSDHEIVNDVAVLSLLMEEMK